jgi:hypothetical protein
MGVRSVFSIQFLFYFLCVVFTAYWPIRGALEGVVAASSLAPALLLATPWLVILFMEGKKMKFQYLPAIMYSIFLSVLTLEGVKEGLLLRSEGLTLIDAVIKNLDGILYLGLLVITGYTSYRSASTSTFTIRLAARIICGVSFLYLGILYIRALNYTITIDIMLISLIFLIIALITTFLIILEYARRREASKYFSVLLKSTIITALITGDNSVSQVIHLFSFYYCG